MMKPGHPRFPEQVTTAALATGALVALLCQNYWLAAVLGAFATVFLMFLVMEPGNRLHTAALLLSIVVAVALLRQHYWLAAVSAGIFVPLFLVPMVVEAVLDRGVRDRNVHVKESSQVCASGCDPAVSPPGALGQSVGVRGD